MFSRLPSQLRSRTPLLAMLVVLITATFFCQQTLQANLQNRNVPQIPSWVGVEPGKGVQGERFCDIDTRLIHQGFLQAPRFRDTVRWWTGTWVGQVPFYRPLTSMLFWTEWKLWGDRESDYNLLAILLHLLAVWELLHLAHALFRRYSIPFVSVAILVSGLVFVNGLFALSKQALITSEVFALWKNQPDSLSLILFCLTLRYYLKQRPVAPLFFYALLCFTKEAGVFLPFLLPIVEAEALRTSTKAERRVIVKRLLPYFVFLFVYLVLRSLFLQRLIGYTYGSNHSWGYLLAANLLGPLSEAILTNRYLPVVLAIFFYGVVSVYRRVRRQPKTVGVKKYLSVVGYGVGGALLLTAMASGANYLDIRVADPVVSLFQIFQPPILKQAAGIVIFYKAVFFTLRRRPFLAAFVYAWAVLALGLTLFSPSVLHRYYLVNAGFSLILGAGTALWFVELLPQITPILSPLSRPAPDPTRYPGALPRQKD